MTSLFSGRTTNRLPEPRRLDKKFETVGALSVAVVDYLHSIVKSLRLAFQDLEGKTVKSIGEITLDAGVTSTTFKDFSVNPKSYIDTVPLTANAALEQASGTFYVSGISENEFTLTHENDASTDRTFKYIVFGG